MVRNSRYVDYIEGTTPAYSEQWDNPGRVLKVMLMFLAKQTELPVTNQDPGFRIHTTNKLPEISICLFFTAVFKCLFKDLRDSLRVCSNGNI